MGFVARHVQLYKTISFAVLICFLFSSTNCERAVPARTDICSRLPNFSGCPKSANAAEKPSAPQPASTAPPAPPAAGDITPAPDATTSAPSDSTPSALSPTTQSPEVQKLCAQYAGLAKQYCVGPPNELPMAKDRCDYWRKYCSKFSNATESPLGAPPCAPYEVQYLTLCVQQQPVNPEIARFCYGYRHACTYGKHPNVLNPGFNAPVGRPLVPAASSTVVDPYPAPWSSIYTHDQRKATLLANGPVPALPNMAPPWSGSPNVAGLSENPDNTPIGSNPVNSALLPGFQSGFAPAPAAVPPGTAVAPVLPTLGNPALPVLPQQPAVPPAFPSPALPSGPGLGVGSGTQVNPFSGVQSGTGVNAGGLPISSGNSLGFGGLTPNVGALGRRRRRSNISLITLLKMKQLGF